MERYICKNCGSEILYMKNKYCVYCKNRVDEYIQGNEGLFISMPSRKTPEGEYKDIVHPINTETREAISKKIIEAYEQESNKAE